MLWVSFDKNALCVAQTDRQTLLKHHSPTDKKTKVIINERLRAFRMNIDMETNRITLWQEDKTSTTIYANLADVSTPIGSVLLLHDMAEHHGRFDDFCRILNGKGYDTYTYDHRGHGSEIRYEDLGYIADDDGYELLISDALHVLKYIKKVNRGRKLILFGQGMGSLVARCIIQAFDSLDACILCSSPNPPQKKINSLLTTTKFIRLSKKPRYKSKYLSKKFTEFKNFSRISNRTSFDWVSRDNQLVGSYISDPLCGFLGTVSFYNDMLNLTDEAIAKTNLKQIKNDLPILLISGGDDPVCNYGEDTSELFDTYQRYHLSEVDCTIYAECRHDLLHETNNAAIIKDILEWLNRALDNRRLRAAAALKAKKKKTKGRNRTAAEAARSALGYASDSKEDGLEDSIQADDLGDDFLEDMGYFNRRTAYNPADVDEEEDDEEFIIMDDDDDFDELDDLDGNDKEPDVQEIKEASKDKSTLRKEAKKAKKDQKAKDKQEKKEQNEHQEKESSDNGKTSENTSGKQKNNSNQKKKKK